MFDFSDIATAIWSDIGSPSSLTVDAIQTRLQSNFFIGKLNNLINKCFSFDSDGNISPEDEFGPEEQNIYMELYKNNYYGQKITENLGAAGLSWVTLKEGDTTIQKTSKTDIAKNFQILKTNSDENLRSLVYSYLSNYSKPESSDFYDIAN